MYRYHYSDNEYSSIYNKTATERQSPLSNSIDYIFLTVI